MLYRHIASIASYMFFFDFQFFSVTYDKGRDKHRKDKLISRPDP